MRDMSLMALRYAAGDLDPVDEAAFEMRLAEDPVAQDALSEAVRLSAAAAGQAAPSPDPLTRQAVAERVAPTWLSRLLARRPYRGHPMAWTAAGAAFAVTLVGFSGQIAPRPAAVPVSGESPSVNPVVPMTLKIEAKTKSIATGGGGVAEDRANHRPSTFLPERPKLDPMGFPDG